MRFVILAFGVLAASPVYADIPDACRRAPSELATAAQNFLKEQGLYRKRVDGQYGTGTREAIEAFWRKEQWEGVPSIWDVRFLKRVLPEESFQDFSGSNCSHGGL